MLQIVYVSTAASGIDAGSLEAILAVSRRNNRRDGITGCLYSDGGRFLQALEGDEIQVDGAVARIRSDPRHRALVTLSRRTIDMREFGDWEMAHCTPGADSTAFLERIETLVANSAPAVRATFEGFARLRHGA